MATRTRASRYRRPGDRGSGEQDQRLTATVTATVAATGYQQRPAAAHNARAIHANSGHVQPHSRKIVRQRRPTENLAYALRPRVPEMSPNRRQ